MPPSSLLISDRTNHPARGLTLLARLIDDLAREFFNQAIDGVIQNNPKARANPKALAQLDGYRRPLLSSLSGNLQRFGMERVAKIESLQEIIAEMTDTAETGEKTAP